MSEPLGKRSDAASAPERRQLANAIRALSMDAVQRANSGHPGAPMGMADIAEVLWRDFLEHNPDNPSWFDRDRFVLSNGHGSMLLYALLHLTGYDVPIDEIKRFRQLGSKTPGHPERGDTPGVETTTGPLGQGLANAVGMAIAERHLACRFNRPGHDIVDHHTYVFAGDGCLMEGISHEACSLAGTLGLGKLVVVYDDNGISIDGEVGGWFTDDTPARFEAYGWHVVPEIDGHEPDAVAAALAEAHAAVDKPSLLCCQTVIGWGAPNKAGTAACHGAALGEEEVQTTREALGWAHAPFAVPEPVYAAWDARAIGAEREKAWRQKLADYALAFPELSREFDRVIANQRPDVWPDVARACIDSMAACDGKEATRKSSERVLNQIAPTLPELVGGSADLTGSNNTFHDTSRTLSKGEPDGNYIFYGVREFAMSAIMNGMCLHGAVIPYGGTFLVFSDYARNAVRMASLMGIGSIFVYTHDSIGLGEDGPTHQPIEHASALRLIPGLDVWRPCDAAETGVAWTAAVDRRDGPSCLLLTRQGLPQQAREQAQLSAAARGGYTLIEVSEELEAIVIATGSETPLAREAVTRLNGQGHAIQLVSMPCAELFERQGQAYRESVLPPRVRKRVAIEAGARDVWYRYVGLDGLVIGLDRFGASAPGGDLFEHFGFTADNCTTLIKDYLEN